MEAFKEKMGKLPPALTLLKIVCMICGGILALVGLWLLIISFITLAISSVIIAFYLVLGGSLIILAELQLKIVNEKLNFLGTHIGRGIFYVFVGSLVFAGLSVDGILAFFLVITGIVVMICGFVQIVFQFIGHKFTSNSSSSSSTDGYEVSYDSPNEKYSDTELKDPSFDPNNYSSGVPIGGANPSYGAPQAGSPSQYGLKAPTYEV